MCYRGKMKQAMAAAASRNLCAVQIPISADAACAILVSCDTARLEYACMLSWHSPDHGGRVLEVAPVSEARVCEDTRRLVGRAALHRRCSHCHCQVSLAATSRITLTREHVLFGRTTGWLRGCVRECVAAGVCGVGGAGCWEMLGDNTIWRGIFVRT